MKYNKIIALLVLANLVMIAPLLLFAGVASADNEPNDSFDSAESIGEGTFSGSVNSDAWINPDTADYYKITIPAYKALLINLTCGSSATIMYTLYDGSRHQITYTTVQNGESSSFWLDGKSKETYYAYLKCENTGSYTFTVQFRPSDMNETATGISVGQKITNTILYSEERHWYKISVPAGKMLNLSASSSGGGIYIKLVDSQGNYINGTSGTSFFLTSDATAGDVYIMVRSQEDMVYYPGARSISYQFTVTLEDAKSLDLSPPPELIAGLTMCVVGIIVGIVLLIVLVVVIVVLLLKKKKASK